MTRNRLASYLLATLVLTLLVACTSDKKEQQERLPQFDMNLQQLATWMIGSFSSGQQAEADSAYYDIRLHMAQVWENRTDGVWMYVEQATASSQNEPYRQRVYRLTEVDDTTYRSDVYTMPEPERFVGAWKKTDPLATLNRDSLELREGCSIVMHPEGDSAFAGGTVGTGCASSLRGAAYATSQVRITADVLYTWDRGWSENDSLVWGARKGGYVFRRIEPGIADTIRE